MRILAVDIGGTNTKMCLCDKQGNVDNFKEYATESYLGGPHVISRLLERIAEYDDFDAIAISTAGQVNDLPAEPSLLKQWLKQTFHNTAVLLLHRFQVMGE